jgi:hypothetical protein
MLAGMFIILEMSWAIWSAGMALVTLKPTNVNPSGSYNLVVMGKSLTVDYAVPKGEFRVSGKATIVKMPEGQRPPERTRVEIQFPVYLIIGLSVGFILLGAMQMRARSILHHKRQTIAHIVSRT